MEVKAYTGRVHMQYRALLRRGLEWYDKVALEIGVGSNDLYTDFENYAQVSVRITPDKKAHQKLMASPLDTSEDIRVKLLEYLNLDIEIIQEWEEAIRTMDAPADEETAPEMDTTDPE